MFTKRVLAMLSAVTVIGALQACTTIGPDQMVVTNGMIASARVGYPFDPTPVTQVRRRNAVVVVTNLKWEPADADGGRHAVEWTWYTGDKLVAQRKRNFKFDKSPAQLSWRIPGADFEPGHYRVTVAVDGKVIDTHEYDIVEG
ncbi:hypothetical protein [Massilia sp. 9096]|uniref:hypothetical protein n=1 Tax=Massilia sp. 9096 TaxID=1500894 RepID=UPI000561A7DA|nr:hypothetical protein [Massilia sp. 9096]